MDNSHFVCVLIGCLFLGSVVASSSDCSGIEEPNRFILCYTDSSINNLENDDLACRCSHLVVPSVVNITQNSTDFALNEEIVAYLKTISGSRNGGRMRRVLSLAVSARDFSADSSVHSIVGGVARMIDDLLIEGVEIHWQQPSTDENSKKDKANLVLFMKDLHAVLQEKVIVTNTPISTTHINSTIADDMEIDAMRPLILLRLPTSPEQLVKGFDLKPLARTVDLFVVSTHNIEDASNATYHHSRLMGISDILNTDSVLDLVTSLGVSSDRVVAAVPTFALQFLLRDAKQNLPGSQIAQGPTQISMEQLHSILKKGNWTIERDDDLTGTYAYSQDGDWIAFDDEMAAMIKAKYFLLRDIAGVAIMPGNIDEKPSQSETPVSPSMTQIYYEQFLNQESGNRTRRQLAKSLQDDLSSVATTLSSPLYNDRVRASPYRIVRIVARSGETSVVRQPLESSLQCSRQGYYRHPEDCGSFYRCVKFDQYVDDFTVFEYDCPEGLVFDEKWEVCTWPSQAAPCGGSSEIRPVPMNKFVCPGEGYFADPENCRWFFACRDYAKDGVTFTQYEFRCPFGLLFDEENLLCNWPWLVPQCSGGAVGSSSNANAVKLKQPLEKKPAAIPMGSPGYLSGKLVTGEGLYKDPRPTYYGESVVSSGCGDCQSAGLVVKEPSQGSYSGKQQTKVVLAIPAATIAGESNPVRIIVASPAYSGDQQYTTTTTTPSYSKAVKYEGGASTGSYQSQKYTDSLAVSGSSDPYGSYASAGNRETAVAINNAQLASYSQTDNKYGESGKVSGPVGPSKPDNSFSYKETSTYDKSTKDEVANTPYYLVKQPGNGEIRGPDRTVENGKYDSAHTSDGKYVPSPSYSAPAYSAPVYSAPAYSEPTYSAPAYSEPTYSAPAYTAPTYSAPAYSAPTYSAPAYSEPAKTAPTYSAPAYSEPTKTAPAYSAPAYSEPAKPAPAYSVPTKSAPAYSAPAYPAPTYSAPTYSSPTYTSSTYSAPEPSDQDYNPVYSAPADSSQSAPSYSAPAYSTPSYSPPAYSAPAYSESVREYKPLTTAAPVYSAPAYTEKAPEYKTSTTAAPVYSPSAPSYSSPVYSAPAYTEKAPEYDSSTTASTVYSAPAYSSPVYSAPAYSSPVYSAPAYSAPVYSAPAYTEKAPEYKTPTTTSPVYAAPAYSAPVYTAPAYTEKAPEYKTPTTTSPVYAAPAYSAPVYAAPAYSAPVYSAPANTEKSPEYKTPTTTSPVYSAPAYTEKAPGYKTSTTAAPVYSAPAYTAKVTEYKTSTTAAPVYSAPSYTEKSPEYKTPTTSTPVYSAPAYTTKAPEYKTPTTAAPVYSAPTYTEKTTGYKAPTTAAPVYSSAPAYSVPAYSKPTAPAYTEKTPGYKTSTTAAPVYSTLAYTEKTVEYKTPITSAPAYSPSVYTDKSPISVYDSTASDYRASNTKLPANTASASIDEYSPVYDAPESVYKTPTKVVVTMETEDQGKKGYRGTGGAAGSAGSRGTGGSAGSRGTGGSAGSQGTDGSAGSRGTGGSAGSRGTGGVGGTRGSKGAVKYSEPEYNPASVRPSAGSYDKNKSTHSTMSRYPSDYETTGQIGDDTFGLKDNSKSKGKYTGSRPLASKSPAANEKVIDTNKRIPNEYSSTNGKSRTQLERGAGSSTSGKTYATVGTTKYQDSDYKKPAGSASSESNSYTTTPHSVSVNYEKTKADSSTKGEISYGDKRVTVKVPSTNKAAILDKWATVSPVTETELALTEQKGSTGDYKSSPRQRIKGRLNVNSKNQQLTTSVAQPSVKLVDSSASSVSLALNKNDGKVSTGSSGSEYGHRYLEKITVAQATAKNETLGPEVCVRAGLFRHPSDCQKFYECYWDRWIHQYTVHIFKCPVHLVYDDYITACNWPLDGPACVPHEAVKLYPQLLSTV
ncbi:flocculation protein FLO11-like isoform X10 [Daphnia pulex]|uniref:flocculation protein FLO11-like isoform X10 n=1 Tax=Daphnia pulex TaxID=6669 RepID=UPI001EE07E58|nr:flocculation protein FLO11-like isoform X10 [Daphnia pulex]